MKKRIVSIALTVLMVVSMMYTTAFAVEPMANNAEEKKVYSVSIDANLLATGGSASGTISTIVLSLPGYSNGWSAGKDVKFSTIIPSNAVVESVEVTPGKLSAGSSTTSPVVTTKYAITSPSGKRVERTYKDTSEIMAFYGESARGTWTFQIYGTNVGPSYGTVNCTSSKITIWYTEQEVLELSAQTYVDYKNDLGSKITFGYSLNTESTNIFVEHDGIIASHVLVGDIPADLYVDPAEDESAILMWTDEQANTIFWIIAPLDSNDLIKIAESVEKEIQEK